MHQTPSVGIIESPGKLNANVEHSRKGPGVSRSVKPSAFDPFSERPTVNELGKDTRNTSKLADVVAGCNVGVKAQVDPSAAFVDEAILLFLGAKELPARAL